MIGTSSIANTAGIMSLLCSFGVVYPTFVHLTSQKNINYRQLVSNISYVGLILSICLGLIHGLLTTQINNIDYSDINTYWLYAGGLFAFDLLIFLAIAFSELKRNLEKFNYFNYALLLLLIFHVGQKIIF